MRAVKDGLPVPYGEGEESEELWSIHAVKLTQSHASKKYRTNRLLNQTVQQGRSRRAGRRRTLWGTLRTCSR